MSYYKLFSPKKIGAIELKNRIVMSPMTRSRAIGNVPNILMAEYYGQRASAGLIITEGTSPSPNGLGYSRIPGIFSDQQVEGWKLVTTAVHQAEGKIMVQLMHTGRISHPLNLPEGTRILAPSAVKPAGKMWTDQEQLQDYPAPEAMTMEDVQQAKDEYVTAAKNAIKAGFDGVELHSANGYLLEQFLSPVSNIRTDNYGGSIENRCRFVVEVAKAVAEAIGEDLLGIRISPYGVNGDMHAYPEIDDTYDYLSKQLNNIGLAFIHFVDHSSMGAPAVPQKIKTMVRNNFGNAIILSGGYDKQRAEADLENGFGELVSFGRPYINNPDLVERFKNNWPLSQDLNTDLFYTPDEKGYTDYPFYKAHSPQLS
jgi:N-ethylmaleimide reductase